MATTMNPSPVPTPPTSNPSSPYPVFPRLGNTGGVQRNASTSSSTSTTTTSSTSSSLVAAPIKPPPIETRTAATAEAQIPPRPDSVSAYDDDDRRGSGSGSMYGGRGFMRNGPRSGRQSTAPPAIVTDPDSSYPPPRSSSVPLETGYGHAFHPSPTTPRAPHFTLQTDHTRPLTGSPTSGPLRVTISMDQVDDHTGSSAGSPSSGRGASANDIPMQSPGLPVPTSPIRYSGGWGSKRRTLSAERNEARDASRDGARDRERRQSQISNHSTSSNRGMPKPSIKDFILGEELGRGSYSTVVHAVSTPTSNNSPSTRRPQRQYAIKIINQAHLIAEKKSKYAIIEKDALVRLAQPRSSASPILNGHRRGISTSSSVQTSAPGSKRTSNASVGSTATALSLPHGGRREREMPVPMGSSISESGSMGANNHGGYFTNPNRYSIATNSSESSTVLGTSGPLASPVIRASRRPSMGAQLPSMVDERAEELESDTEPPNPTDESSKRESKPSISIVEPAMPASESRQGTPAGSPVIDQAPTLGTQLDSKETERARTPGKPRRTSLAPSEMSTKSGRSGYQGHPGIIRLHVTFADSTSLYFVLDLAPNGELLGHIRQYGSLDITSARFYAAQLIDTIEYMHERGVIHRDLKPENILLDEDMRIKVTDFGSAKLLSKEGGNASENEANDGKKRSFVGSADFVSPEVLRNEPAVIASDIWAFGCILYQFIVGRPPFRGATDYLTFQRILKKEMVYPPGFDEDAKALVELILNLDPAQRPSPSEIKAHPFFGTTDFGHLWTKSAPKIQTGLTKPVTTLANVDPTSDVWAVFDDEVSDGGFEYDLDGPESPAHPLPHQTEPLFDGPTAAEAVRFVDGKTSRRESNASSGSLGFPRRGWLDSLGGERKKRGLSSGSAGASSTTSSGKMGLSGLLESMGIGERSSGVSTMTSSGSLKTEDVKEGIVAEPAGMEEVHDGPDVSKWTSLLLTNENILYASPITIKQSTSLLPSFLRSDPRTRHLILTDFPRLITLKEESDTSSSSPSGSGLGSSNATGGGNGKGGWKIKTECIFLARGSGIGSGRESPLNERGNVPNVVLDVSERGSKGFVVQTISQSYHYLVDSPEIRGNWISSIKRFLG